MSKENQVNTEENKEVKNFLDNIKRKMLKQNIRIGTLSVIITIMLLVIAFLLYYNIKFPVSLDTVFVEWVAESSVKNLGDNEDNYCIAFEITNINNQNFSDVETEYEDDMIIIKLGGNRTIAKPQTYGVLSLNVTNKNAVYLQGKDVNDRMLVWERGMKIMTVEEWEKWYHNVYFLHNALIRFERSRGRY